MGEISVTKEQALNRAAFDRWQGFCGSRKGLTLMFLWAVAEAIVWPIIPDALLFPVAIGGRRRYWKILGAAVLGSALGGIAIYLFAYFMPGAVESILPRLPCESTRLVQDFMIQRAKTALAQQGVMAFWTQPWSGVSYKVYALEGAARRFDPAAALCLSILARSLRMFVTSVCGLFDPNHLYRLASGVEPRWASKAASTRFRTWSFCKIFVM
ncbi:MAG: hypothetical protein EXR62_04405 [Chloroflexi bacterium]|nr:hypothetical protein [Chloroflexota bacterium]